jgi:ribonuclease HI
MASSLTLPSPSIVTHNINSAHSSLPLNSPKRTQLTTNTLALAAKFDVIQYQQTRLDRKENFYLQPRLPDHQFYYNNYTNAAAGTLMIVSPSLHQNYHIKHVIIQQGYIHALFFSPKRQGSPGFTVVNAYLYTGDLKSTEGWPKRQLLQMARFNGKTYALSVHVRRAYQLSLINQKVQRQRYLFCGGDLNFHENKDDSSNSNCCSNALFLHHWADFLERHRLRELYQPIKTYYFISRSDPHASHCTRIDRLYCSYDEADFAITKPTVYCPRIPFSIPASYTRAFSLEGNRDAPERKHTSSDHIPVGYYFTEPAPAARKPSLPKFIINNPQFQEELTRRWNQLPKRANPFEEHEELIKLAMRTARTYRKKPAKCENQQIAQLSTGFTVLRAVSRHSTTRTSILELQQRFPETFEHVRYNSVTNTYDTSRLRRHIKRILEGAKEEAATKPTTKGNLVKQLKIYMPSSRAFITRLRENEEEIGTEDPTEIAQIEQRFYQQLWRHRDAHVGRIEEVLFHYAKEITTTIERPTSETVEAVLAATNDSCPGPDGIPPIFYKVFNQLVTPIILGILAKLELPQPPPDDFNWGTLFCLPKKVRDWIVETRPITVPNSINRIVSRSYYAVLQPATVGFLDEAQHACKGKNIGVPIKQINDSFYRKAREQMLELLLLLDFRKAFDMVLHEFLHKLMEHIGLPGWLRTAIRNLLHNLGAFTSVRGAKELFIRVFNGVKQGCPLSPLIFCLLMDPLLHFLRNPPRLYRELAVIQLRSQGFCDDVGSPIGTRNELTFFIRVVNFTIKALGFEVNFRKTVIIPNLPIADNEELLAPFRALLLEQPGWNEVRFVDSAKYLGILIGPKLTLDQQFAAPLEDIKRKAKSFYPVVSRLAVHKRIVTCNTWILSKLTFKHNYFMIPPGVAQKVEAACTKLVVPWNIFSVDLLYNSPKYCNLNQALREFNYANLAALASQYSEELEQEVHRTTGTTTEDPVFVNQYCNPIYPFSANGEWNTNIIDEHIFLAYHYIQTEYQIQLEYNTPSSVIYRQLMDSEFHKARSRVPIVNMLSRFAAQSHVETVISNFSKIDRKLGDHPRYDQIRILANGVPTSRRLAPLHRADSQHVPHLEPGLPCFFCGEYADSNEHFLLSEDCCVITLARFEVALHHVGHKFYNSARQASLLLEPYTKKQVNVLVAFNRTVLLTRQQIVNGVKFRFLKYSITDQTKQLLQRTVSASGKHVEEAKATVKLVNQLQAKPQVILCFSDGSSFDNPGPAGAGAVLQLHGQTPISKSVALGTDTNNVAELWAYGMVLDTLIAWSQAPLEGYENCTEAHVFIDSRYVIDIFTKKSMPRQHLQLISRIWDKQHTIAETLQIDLHWSPGHTGIELNELADSAAKEGAGNSSNNIGIGVEERLASAHPFTHPPNRSTEQLNHKHYLYHDYPP